MKRIGFLLIIAVIAVASVGPWNRGSQSLRGVLQPTNSLTASAWDKPAGTNPVTVDLSATASTQPNDSWQLNTSQDYVFTCSTNPVTMPHILTIWGGHDVVIEDCDIQTQSGELAKLENTTGTLWLHDDDFEAAPGDTVGQGIQLQEPGSTTVVMRDVLEHSLLHGSQATNHAECIQTWSGPQRLLIDGFTCDSQYQGFFLLPNQYNSTSQETVWDFRHVDITGTGAYLGWLGDVGPGNRGNVDFEVSNFYENGTGEPHDYPNVGQWADVLSGLPPQGHYVTPTSYGATGPDEPCSGVGCGTVQGAWGGGEDPIPLVGEQQ